MMTTPFEITGEELAEMLVENPDWIAQNATRENPVKVTTFCDLAQSPIRALSPHITFAGQNPLGEAATFERCEHLEVAEGVFYGFVGFDDSAIRRIGELTVSIPDKTGRAASFRNCERLEAARGTFHGQVSFEASKIRKIDVENLRVVESDNDGCAADFFDCRQLEVAEGKFPGAVDFGRSGIVRIGELELTLPMKDGVRKPCQRWIANFQECMRLTAARGTYPKPVTFANSGVRRISSQFKVVEEHATEKYEGDFSGCKRLSECPSNMLANQNIDPVVAWAIHQGNLKAEKARATLRKEGPTCPEL